MPNILTTIALNPLSRPTNLAVAPGETLALAGGNITVEGAQLSAPGGRVVLGGVGPQSFVGIAPTGDFTYDRTSDFQDIHLDRSATVNVSGDGGGRLQLRGRRISLTDDSVAIAYNLGDESNAFSGIDVRADELDLQGESILSSLAIGSGRSGDASIQVATLTLNRAVVATTTLGAGDAGRITIRAADAISLTNTSAITTTSIFGSGAGGSIEIETRRLTLGNTGQISSSTQSLGPGGTIEIQASESIALNPGPSPALANASGALFGNGLFSSTDVSAADAGNIIIETDRLTASGASIFSATFATGKAGTISIRANSFEAIGLPVEDGEITFVSSGGAPAASGPAGNAIVMANEIVVRAGAELLVSHAGSGDAGTLNVVADTLTLEDGGAIVASTVSGEGGSITVDADALVLRREGRIATNAGSADGGNIAIDTDVLVALENSDITANAEMGFGGRVSVAAAGVFGTAFRERPTPQSDITATSALGPSFDGVVAINELEVDPGNAFVDLSVATIDASSELDRDPCKKIHTSQFIMTGSGGLPSAPFDLQNIDNNINPWMALSEALSPENRVSQRPTGSIQRR